MEGAKFPDPPFLFPTEKGCRPFNMWCLDSIVNLAPATPSGAQNVIVAVDPYSKWVEASPVDNLTSHEAANWLHSQIVCRYGVPYCIRTDRGVEY